MGPANLGGPSPHILPYSPIAGSKVKALAMIPFVSPYCVLGWLLGI